MKKTTVLQLGWTGEVGGMEKSVSNISTHVDKEKYETHVCYLHKGGLLGDSIDGTRVRKKIIGMKSGLDIRGAFRFWKFMTANSFDIIHVHTNNLIANLIVLLNPAKKIYHEHMHPLYQRPRKSLFFYRFILPFYDRIIVVSEFLRSIVAGIIRKRTVEVDVLHNFIEIPDGIRKKNRKISDKITVGYVGRLREVKNPFLFLEIAGYLSKKSDRYEFLLTGDGPLKAEVQRVIEEKGLRGNVKTLGFSNDVDGIMQSLDILLLTSDTETFGMVAIEAMANEVLVMARKVGGIPEIIEDGKTGILFDEDLTAKEISDKIDRKIRSINTQQIIVDAKTFVREKYDIRRNIYRLENIYRETVSADTSV